MAINPARNEKLREFAQSDDREWTPFFAGRNEVISNIEAACLRTVAGGDAEHSQWTGRRGATRVIQGAPGAGKSSLLQHLEHIWLKRRGANEPAPIPVKIPIHALDEPGAFATAIGNGLPSSLLGTAKGLLSRIEGMSVMGAGLNMGRSSPSSPEELQIPRNRAVVLMIDEAQNLDLSAKNTAAVNLLLWLHQGDHGLPLLPVLAGLANLEGLLANAGISRLSVDAVHTLGCLSRDETRLSADRFFDYFGISPSELRNTWSENIFLHSEGWPVHLHHCFRALSASLADAVLRLEAVDGGAFRREEARMRSAYNVARTDSLPIELVARVLDSVGPTGRRDQYEDAIDSEHDARRGGRAFRFPDGMDAEKLFERLAEKGLLQRNATGEFGIPIASLENFVVASSGSSLHLLALSGSAAGMKIALMRGRDPNAADIRQRTPLHIAAECGWTDIAEMLLKAGANPEATDLKGRRPIELLPRYASAELKEILTTANVRDPSPPRPGKSSAKPTRNEDPSLEP